MLRTSMESSNKYLNYMKDYLKKIDDVIESGEYKDNWNSLAGHPIPSWYRDAKFGIFLHWGVFSVPAFNSEWYPCWMYRKENECYKHHLETYGDFKKFGYKDFIPMSKNEKFDPDQWVSLFKEAGAKYIMPVAEHCDGFPMYDCGVTDWCASKMGPKKDMVGLLRESVKKQGLEFAASSHRVEHYWFMNGVQDLELEQGEEIPYSDMYWPSVETHMKNLAQLDVHVDELYMQDWLVRTCELVDKYRPRIMYFDWWIQVYDMKPYLKKFAAYYYNRAKEWGQDVTINFKNDAFMYSVGVQDIERGQMSSMSERFWQNDTAVAKNSWCYTVNNEYKESNEILSVLVDVVSKNGALLLNVGPKPDGTISEEDTHVLKEIGKWMKVNGEAIYGSNCWRKFGEGPTQTTEGHFSDMNQTPYTSDDFRFTFNNNCLYVFSLKWPEDGVVRIKTLGARQNLFNPRILNVEMLDKTSTCKYILTDDHLTVISQDVKDTKNPVCIKITME